MNCEEIGEQHEWDDDGVCTKCGFDGAEENHLKRLAKIARDNEY
jgi:hypothetical protein